ncbi:ubiquitin carboxyl-terminal hydrolase [Bulinus truncatus]|nr:ubiquitin carboxyl-terminal hydrolase [Bulinus truncatus]
MGSAGDWCLIESDPGVFTELIKGFGCRGAQVEEIWSLDPESFESLKPVHGLIFLFKWSPNQEPDESIVQDSRLQKIFFASQVINNACATQAILSILLNCTHEDIELGDTLSNFKDFAQDLDPGLRGLSLRPVIKDVVCDKPFVIRQSNEASGTLGESKSQDQRIFSLNAEGSGPRQRKPLPTPKAISSGLPVLHDSKSSVASECLPNESNNLSSKESVNQSRNLSSSKDGVIYSRNLSSTIDSASESRSLVSSRDNVSQSFEENTPKINLSARQSRQQKNEHVAESSDFVSIKLRHPSQRNNSGRVTASEKKTAGYLRNEIISTPGAFI